MSKPGNFHERTSGRNYTRDPEQMNKKPGHREAGQ
jgi:hypothetical protein